MGFLMLLRSLTDPGALGETRPTVENLNKTDGALLSERAEQLQPCMKNPQREPMKGLDASLRLCQDRDNSQPEPQGPDH